MRSLAAPLTLAATAMQYIDPGSSARDIALVFGVMALIVAAVVGILWYPVRSWMRSRADATGDPSRTSEADRGQPRETDG